ncbi:putative mage family protein [Erysiphe necator]|uniref:Putative mage family protein n=1 Tax=Uncinula necator TaxID=52586 RepID=A0A0B1P8W8_UNCNE|nr:putative mage family protein [Erysiphe necator]
MSSRSQRIVSSERRRSGVAKQAQEQELASRFNDRSAQSPDESSRDEEEEDDDDDDNNNEANSSEDLDQTVKKVIRYVLACDYQRLTIKRSGITEKVIGKQRGNFKKVFKEAQQLLRDRFGLEMVELPARQKVTLREKKAAKKSKGNSTSSTSYILKTTLPYEYRKPEIIPLSTDWSTSDEYAYIGLYTTIICLISLSADKQMANHQLDRYLKRLNLDRNTGLGTTSELLARMKKENYLQETKTNDKDGETSEWRVGPRGFVEVDRKAITRFVQNMYGMNAPEDILHRLQRSLGADKENGQETPA